MGCLEELHHFDSIEIKNVIHDIQQEYDPPIMGTITPRVPDIISDSDEIKKADPDLRKMDDRLIKMENSISSVLHLLKEILSSSNVKKKSQKKSSRTMKFNTYPYNK